MKTITTQSILFIGLTITGTVSAQNEVDALRYSRPFLSGTARYTAMGGSFGALGADFSNLSFNPAGVALYKKSELTFTPSIFAGNTVSDYNGTVLSNNKYGFNIGNAGLVIGSYWGEEKTTGWFGSGIGLGYNRLASFHNRMDIEGINTTSSFLNIFINRMNSGDGKLLSEMNPMDEELFWNTYLVNPSDTFDTTNYYVSVIQDGAKLLQRKNKEASGSLGEWIFSLGGNYSNRLYLGATVGVPVLYYKETTSFQEILQDDTISPLSQYSFNQDLVTQGYGVNFKFGFIYRINNWVRFGGAVHTPTFLQLSDEYTNAVRSEFRDGTEYSDKADGAMNYQLNTPLKFTSSLGIIVKKIGSVNIDYEFLDYGEPRLRSSYYKYFDENKSIESKYTEANNIKIGTEWLLESFSIRAGWGVYGSPFKKGLTEGTATVYSGGFGLREEGYFLDFGYSYTKYNESYYLYDPAFVPAAGLTNFSHNFLVTLGYKF
ncbi:MAG: hypothetical protein HYY40_02050 [Bacteroidetes bacterium]|nr:hypothetical protein [Bacteroidota bacterium]